MTEANKSAECTAKALANAVGELDIKAAKCTGENIPQAADNVVTEGVADDDDYTAYQSVVYDDNDEEYISSSEEEIDAFEVSDDVACTNKDQMETKNDDDDFSSFQEISSFSTYGDASSQFSMVAQPPMFDMQALHRLPCEVYNHDTDTDSISIVSGFDILTVNGSVVLKCHRCTFLNPNHSPACEMCHAALVANPFPMVDHQLAKQMMVAQDESLAKQLANEDKPAKLVVENSFAVAQSFADAMDKVEEHLQDTALNNCVKNIRFSTHLDCTMKTAAFLEHMLTTSQISMGFVFTTSQDANKILKDGFTRKMGVSDNALVAYKELEPSGASNTAPEVTSNGEPPVDQKDPDIIGWVVLFQNTGYYSSLYKDYHVVGCHSGMFSAHAILPLCAFDGTLLSLDRMAQLVIVDTIPYRNDLLTDACEIVLATVPSGSTREWPQRMETVGIFEDSENTERSETEAVNPQEEKEGAEEKPARDSPVKIHELAQQLAQVIVQEQPATSAMNLVDYLILTTTFLEAMDSSKKLYIGYVFAAADQAYEIMKNGFQDSVHVSDNGLLAYEAYITKLNAHDQPVVPKTVIPSKEPIVSTATGWIVLLQVDSSLSASSSKSLETVLSSGYGTTEVTIPSPHLVLPLAPIPVEHLSQEKLAQIKLSIVSAKIFKTCIAVASKWNCQVSTVQTRTRQCAYRLSDILLEEQPLFEKDFDITFNAVGAMTMMQHMLEDQSFAVTAQYIVTTDKGKNFADSPCFDSLQLLLDDLSGVGWIVLRTPRKGYFPILRHSHSLPTDPAAKDLYPSLQKRLQAFFESLPYEILQY